MKSKLKAVMSFLLVLALVVSLIPVLPAHAEEPEYSVAIMGDGAKSEIKWNHSDETYEFSFGEIVGSKAGVTIAEAWGIESLSNPVFWNPDRIFSGWMVYKEVRDEEGNLELEEVTTKPISTEQMLQYKVPQYDIQIVAKWADIDEVYYTYVAFDAWGGLVEFTDEYMDGDELVSNTESFDYRSFYMERRTDGNLGYQLKNRQNVAITKDPVKEGDTFEGWLKITEEIWIKDGESFAKDILESETPMTTEEVMNDELPGGLNQVRYLAKWESIPLSEYIGDSSEECIEHVFSEWEVLLDATCTQEGEQFRYCENCGAEEFDIVPMNSKNHDWDKDKTTKAGYGKDGSITYTCGNACGQTKNEIIPMVKSVKLEDDTFDYDGGKHIPNVIVKDSKGKTLKKNTDYTVSYKTIKSLGEHKVTVTFKGNYSGSKSVTATVVPKKPSSVKVKLSKYNDVKVSWKKSSGASGYYVYYKKSSSSSYSKKYVKAASKSTLSYTLKDLAKGKEYDIRVRAYYKDSDGDKHYSSYSSTKSLYTLKKISTPKVKKSGSKIKVSWTNISGETGYQISQSTSKKKTKIVATYKTTSGKSKKISAKKGKTYYYKVRAYKTVDGKKVYGPWSSVKSYKRK